MNGRRKIITSTLLSFLVLSFFGCGRSESNLEGEIRYTSERFQDKTWNPTVRSDTCRVNDEEGVDSRVIFICDWLKINTALSARPSNHSSFDINQTYELSIWVEFAYHKQPEHFEGATISDAMYDCLYNSEPTGTVTRLDETEWKSLRNADFSRVFDIEFEHGCASGSFRYFKNIDFD